MPDFDEEINISDQGKVKTVLAAGALGLFRDQLGEGMFGGLADGAHFTPDQMFISANGKARVRIEGDQANIWLGGGGQGGDVVLFPASVADAFQEVAQSTILLAGNQGVIVLRSNGKETVRIDGPNGDIVLANADCAEDFEIEDDDDVDNPIEPGSVLVVADTGRLRLTDQPYDRRVAGVVSGAGGLKPGIVLGRRPTGQVGVPIGLAGRVYCKVDATDHPVETGDLLATAATLGHAMAVVDPGRAFGAVLGKALAPLPDGRALLPVLVSLQ